jgi:hypothetical protein
VANYGERRTANEIEQAKATVAENKHEIRAFEIDLTRDSQENRTAAAPTGARRSAVGGVQFD